MKVKVRKKQATLRIPKKTDAGQRSAVAGELAKDEPPSLTGDEFRDLFDKMYDAVLIVDREGVVRAANRRASMFFSYDAAAMRGMDIYTLISGFDKAMFDKLCAHIFSGRYTVISASCIRSDRRAFSAAIALSEVTFDGKRGLAFAIRNDNRKEKIRAQLRTEHNALLNAACAIVVADRDKRIDFVNNMFLNMWGYQNDDQVTGTDVASLWEDRESARDLLENPGKGGMWNGELRAQGRDGRLFWVQATSASNLDESGAVVGLVFSFIDISERYEAETAIRKEVEGQIDVARGRDEFSGLLNIVTIQDLFQLIDSTSKTGKLMVENEFGAVVGWAAFNDGSIVAAECGERKGEAAVVELLVRGGERFEFLRGALGDCEQTIRRPTMGVLLDASRMADERA